MPAAPERGCELVHHAAVDAGGALLGALASKGGFDAVELGAQPRRDGDQKCGRRAQTRPGRDIRLHHDSLRRYVQLDADRAHVLETAADIALDRPITRAAPADTRVAIDRSRRHDSAQIVDVLSAEVYPSGCAAMPRSGALPLKLHEAPRPCPPLARRR